jgi:hypothetical protein
MVVGGGPYRLSSLESVNGRGNQMPRRSALQEAAEELAERPVGLAVYLPPHHAAAHGGRALLGRFDIAEVPGCSIELATK